MGRLVLKSRHRVCCGDSTKAADVHRLMGVEKADLILTDPPYGADYDGMNRMGRCVAKTALENDTSDDDALNEFAEQTCSLLDSICRSGAAVYVFGMLQRYLVWRPAFDRHFTIRALPIWVKDNPAAGRSDFFWGYEIIFYGVKPGKRHTWNGGRGQSDVWQFRNVNSFGYIKDDGTRNAANDAQQHPTQKPVDLIAHAMSLSSNIGDLCADPFLGSGTTVIAGEQLGRRVFGLEISPAYTDVSVIRWQRLTGERAIRESDGAAFDDLRGAGHG